LPSTRRCNPWTKSNAKDNCRFLGKKLKTCFDLIVGCKTIPEIVYLMNDGDDKYFEMMKAADRKETLMKERMQRRIHPAPPGVV
jgi:hypothetical protein